MADNQEPGSPPEAGRDVPPPANTAWYDDLENEIADEEEEDDDPDYQDAAEDDEEDEEFYGTPHDMQLAHTSLLTSSQTPCRVTCSYES